MTGTIVKLKTGEIVKILDQVKLEDYMCLTKENTTTRVNAFAILGIATVTEKNQFTRQLNEILSQ